MNKRPTRLVAVLLALLMCMTLLPVTALADIAALPARAISVLQSKAATSTWPQIATLSVATGATLECANRPAKNRNIVDVTYTNYEQARDGGKEENVQTWIAGEITIYIDEEMASGYTYKPSKGALSVSFKDIPEGWETGTDFYRVQFKKNATEKDSNSFAGIETTDGTTIYIYKLKIAVKEAVADYDYPVLTKLDVADNAVLTGLTDRSTILITGAKFENYAAANNGTNTDGDTVKVSGKVTIYIASVFVK